MHFHGYEWTGDHARLSAEAERRPAHASFRASRLPPICSGDWLAKPPERSLGRFDAALGAVGWASERYDLISGAFASEAIVPLKDRQRHAFDVLPLGIDVTWEEPLYTGLRLMIAVVCCSPNRHSLHPCPAPARRH